MTYQTQSRRLTIEVYDDAGLVNRGLEILDAYGASTTDRDRAETAADAAQTAAASVLALDVANYALPTNTAAENDAGFAAMATDLAGGVADLRGLTYPVTAVPVIRAENGFWQVANFDDGLTALLPAADTVKVNTVNITTSKRYDSWPQDKIHTFKPSGPYNANSEEILLLPWVTGSGHGNADMFTSMIRGTPKRMGPKIERLFQGVDGSTIIGGSSWSAGQIYGQQLIIERRKDASNEVVSHHLWGRRLHEFRQNQALSISTVSGSTTRTVTFTGTHNGDKHGLKAGDRFGVAGASGPIGGVLMTGDYTVVSVVNENTLTVNGTAATSTETGAITTSRVIFYEDSFAEILFGGLSISAALTAFNGTNWPAPVTEMHSFGHCQDSDDFWVTQHGGTGNAAGCWIVKVSNVLSAAAITAEVLLNSQGVEPAIWHVDATGKIYGALRSQSTTLYPLRLFTHDPVAGTTTLRDFPNNAFATKCVMSGDEWNGKLVAAVNGNRGRLDTTPAGPVNLYVFVWDSLADFTANGFTNAKAYHVGTDNWQADTFLGTDTSAVGVGSVTVTDRGVICIAGSQENPNTSFDLDGQPDIVLRYVYDILASEPYEGAWGSWSAQYANEPPMPLEIHRVTAKVDVSGTFELAPRTDGHVTIAVTSGGTGLYNITFADAVTGAPVTFPAVNYTVQAIGSGGPNYARLSGPVASGFTVITTNITHSAVASDFFLSVEYPDVWTG